MKKIFIIIVLFWFITIPSGALDIENGVDITLNIVPDKISQSLEKNSGLTVLELIKAPPSAIIGLVTEEIKSNFIGVASTLSMVIAIILLTTVICSLSIEVEQATDNIIQLCCCLWTIYILSNSISSCIGDGINAIGDCTNFMLSYIPIYTGIATAAGLPASSLVYHSTLMWVGQIISQITQNFLAPLIGVFLSVSLSGILSENAGLFKLGGAIKKSMIWTLILLMTIFVGFVTMQSFITGMTDLSVGKTAKFLIGSFVPVVGSVIADAISVAKGSMGIIKATVGSMGIIVTVLFFLPVIVKITIWRIAICLGSLIGEIMGVPYASKVLGAFSDTLTILTAVILSVSLIFIISTGVILSLGVV